ncbi:MAG: thioredoxin-dependent thiol peroxidase [Spirochaetales bacterium]|nr:thioredoxin-dependent thiol peroxidase [Spirochaetales bacterium]MDD6840680.1 thioredoxin-dependent thiol peroxidase [Spirochaetales bacterium]
MLEVGNKAPSFTLVGDDGKEYSLEDYKGKKVLLYFYPKDNTPGCTKEACSLRDWNSEIIKRGVTVMGVSKDSIQSHNKFREKHGLNFILLSDPEKTVHMAYDAWGEKKLYGKISLGTIRKTFLIDENGNIEKIWNKVAVATHGEDVVKYLDKE